MIDSYHREYLSNLSKSDIVELLINECIPPLNTNLLTLTAEAKFHPCVSYQIAKNCWSFYILDSNKYKLLWSKIVTNAMKLATTLPADQIDSLLVQQHAAYISIQSLNEIWVNSNYASSNKQFIRDNVMTLFNRFIIQDTSEADVFTLNSKKHTQVSLFLELLTKFGTGFIGIEHLRDAYYNSLVLGYYKNSIKCYSDYYFGLNLLFDISSEQKKKLMLKIKHAKVLDESLFNSKFGSTVEAQCPVLLIDYSPKQKAKWLIIVTEPAGKLYHRLITQEGLMAVFNKHDFKDPTSRLEIKDIFKLPE